MAQDKPKSLTESYSEMVTQWERNYDAFANQVMGTEGFSQAMNEMQKAQLGYQKMFSQAMSQQLAAANIPSRDDIINLAEAIQKIDRRLERIEEKLTTNDAPKRTKKRPPRSKKPPVKKQQPEASKKDTKGNK